MPQETNDNTELGGFRAFFVKYFKIILVVNIITIFSVAYFLLLRPQYIQYKTAPGREKELLEEELLLKKQRLSELQIYKKALNIFSESQRQRLADFLPAGKGTPELFVQLDALAQEAGLHLDSVTITEASTDQPGAEWGEEPGPETLSESRSPVKVLNIRAQLSGGHYVNLKNFLRETEKNLRLLDILSVNFVGEGGVFAVAMKAYYIGE